MFSLADFFDAYGRIVLFASVAVFTLVFLLKWAAVKPLAVPGPPQHWLFGNAWILLQDMKKDTGQLEAALQATREFHGKYVNFIVYVFK